MGNSFSERFRKFILILFVLSIPSYLTWRIFFTFNIESPISSTLFLIADFITLFSTSGFVISLWNLKKQKPASYPKEGMKVDVWIPTYNEPIEILRRTIYAAVNMDYSHETYVLDDGKRKDVRELAESLGAKYITRENNLHGKAGNLNNALKYTHGDFIASFDADFIPQKNFLTKLLGHFNDEKVALVQSPQSYYNLSSFQHKKSRFLKRFWNEQDSFFNLVFQGRNNYNSAYWIGTSAIIRRKAIESINGFPTDSVVEDMLTSIFLHAKKWKTIYEKTPLSFGLAPSTLSHFLIQRLRWARGVSQILRKHNPIFKKGLTKIQKFFYTSSIIHFFEGSAKMIYYFLPALYLLTGITPIKPGITNIVIIFSYVLFTFFSLFIISKKQVSFYNDEVYGMIRFLTYAIGNLQLFINKNLKFAVTPKDESQDKVGKLIIGPSAVFLVNMTAIVYTIILLYRIQSISLNFISFCVIFCFYFAFMAFQALRLCFSYSATHSSAIYETKFFKTFRGENCLITSWDDKKVQFLSINNFAINEVIPFSVEINKKILNLKLKIKHKDCSLIDDKKFYTYSGRFFELKNAERYELINHIFRDAVKTQGNYENPLLNKIKFSPTIVNDKFISIAGKRRDEFVIKVGNPNLEKIKINFDNKEFLIKHLQIIKSGNEIFVRGKNEN